MTIKQIQAHLARLFTTRAEANPDNEDMKEDDTIIYDSEYMNRDNVEQYAIYNAVSTVAHDSGLTHNFSYEIASRAVDILAEIEDWQDDDAITEAIDASVPIYTSKLIQIYTFNSWTVDEAREELGTGEDSTTKNAMQAWYIQIQNMVNAIRDNLTPLLEDKTGGNA